MAALANFVDARVPTDEQVRGTLNMAFASRESEVPDDDGLAVLAFNPYSVGESHDLDPTAVRTLFARLELRGIVRALTPVYDTYQLPIDHDPTVVTVRLGEGAGDVWTRLIGAARRGRTWITLTVSEAAPAVGLSRSDAARAVRQVEEAGLVDLRPSGALLRFRVLRRPNRDKDTPYLLGAVREAIEAEHVRLAAVREYVLETRCRQRHALVYLGEAAPPECGVCDLCRGAAPIPLEALHAPDWQAEFDPADIDSLAEVGRDTVGIARALCKVTTARSRAYRRHPAWGRLERAPYAGVLSLVHRRLD
jgi:ATP-dependent DNA helicase RecQ